MPMSVFSWWFWAWLIFGPGPIPILGLSPAKLTKDVEENAQSLPLHRTTLARSPWRHVRPAIHFGKKMAGSICSLYILCRNCLERIGYRIPRHIRKTREIWMCNLDQYTLDTVDGPKSCTIWGWLKHVKTEKKPWDV